MRFNFKKVASVLASAVMLGSTMGIAAAANYPAPFVQGGTANVAIVVGANAATSDMTAATSLGNDLATYLSVTNVTTNVTTGDIADLTTGTDKIYLTEGINTVIQTLTDDDLSNVLADGTFTDDDGDEFDYSQTMDIGDSAFTFSNSGNDLDNPALIIDVGDDTADPLYTLSVIFDEAVDFNDDASKGEEIVLFGKTYTIGTGTDADTLQLFGGASTVNLDTEKEESTTVTIGTKTYTVTLLAVSEAGDEVKVKLSDGTSSETETIDEGASKKLLGVTIYVKDCMSTTKDEGTATLLVGAEELYLEDNNPVMEGSDKTEIDGTNVDFTGTVDALTRIDIAVAAEDSDVDHILAGEGFTDPVFGSVKVNFASVKNGPEIEGDKGNDASTTRKKVEFKRASDDAVSVTLDVKGKSKTVEFDNGGDLEDDDGQPIHVVEGKQFDEDDYLVLKSGNFMHLVQATKVECSADADAELEDDLTLKDVFSGDTFSFDNQDVGNDAAYTWTIEGQDYHVLCTANDHYTIVSDAHDTNDDGDLGDDGESVYVYPTIKTISGKDIAFAFTDQVLAIDEYQTGVAAGSNDRTIVLPTGELTIDTNGHNDQVVVGGTTLDLAGTTEDAVQVGTVWYNVKITDGTGANKVDITVSIDSGQDNDVDDEEDDAGLLFIEEEDNSDGDNMNAVVIPTQTNAGGYDEIDLANIKFTSPHTATETFDDTDYRGTIDSYGTYLIEDSSDEDQDMAWFTYPEEQMYAEVSVAEITGVTTTTPAVSIVPVTDAEIESVKAKNLIVVGGSCVNSVARHLIDASATAPICGADFTAKTGIGEGNFLIKAYQDAYTTGAIALLVAGYEAADTEKAVSYLKDRKPEISSSTELKLETATYATVA